MASLLARAMRSDRLISRPEFAELLLGRSRGKPSRLLLWLLFGR